MKLILLVSIITLSFVLVSILPHTAFGNIGSMAILEQYYGKPNYQLNDNGSTLIVSNILNKTSFTEREPITVIPKLTNLGNNTIRIGYDPVMFDGNMMDEHGQIVSSNGGVDLLVSFAMTVKPHMSSPAYVLADNAIQKENFVLYDSGNYSITSIASFYNSTGSKVFLWSKPTQIIVLSANTLSPLKQFKSEFAARDVKCKEGLQLIVKNENGKPACVKPQTAQKLIERGWGMSVSSSR